MRSSHGVSAICFWAKLPRHCRMPRRHYPRIRTTYVPYTRRPSPFIISVNSNRVLCSSIVDCVLVPSSPCFAWACRRHRRPSRIPLGQRRDPLDQSQRAASRENLMIIHPSHRCPIVLDRRLWDRSQRKRIWSVAMRENCWGAMRGQGVPGEATAPSGSGACRHQHWEHIDAG